ncbi:hypothetical protein [Sphingorhabdus sp. EL138]|nr:hypothetical protein [Sphingorhabdus sp. EL138]
MATFLFGGAEFLFGGAEGVLAQAPIRYPFGRKCSASLDFLQI